MSNKDYLFLFFVTFLLMIFVWFFSIKLGEIGPTSSTAYESVIQNTDNIFRCGEHSFSVNVPVEKFEFTELNNRNPRIKKECFWLTSEYKMFYLQYVSDYDKKEAQALIYNELKNENPNFETRLVPNGTETITHTSDENLRYDSGRFILVNNGLIFISLISSNKIEFDSPDFRRLSDSFEFLN
jgi:hypothetical protein